MKKLWNSFLIAFAMYSKVPVKHADWDKENMRFTMCFFPLVGVLVGALVLGWMYLCRYLGTGSLLTASVAVVLPVLVTGGIHLDGFLDTSDAMGSWREREKRLEILKDSHIGAAAFSSGAVLFLLNLGFWSQMRFENMMSVSAIFVISRILSGLSVAAFPCAKESGLLHTFQSAADRKTVRGVMLLELVLALAWTVFWGRILAAFLIPAALFVFGWYYRMSMKYFGGITGDLAGWFLQVCECAMAAAAMIGSLSLR